MESPVVLLITAAFVAGAAFLLVEAHIERPMLPLEFFRLPSFSPATLVGFVVNFTIYGAIFAFNLFLQRLAGYSPTRSGLAFLPFPVSLLAANLCAGPLVARFGSRLPMAAGLAVAGVGFALLSAVSARTPWLAMLPGLIVLPAGIGMAVPAMTAVLLSSVPRPRSGVALFGSFLAHDGTSGMHFAFLLALVLLGAMSLLALLGIGASCSGGKIHQPAPSARPGRSVVRQQ